MDTRQKSEIVFKEFLELVDKLTSNDQDMHRRLQRSYDRTNPHFRWSRGFINLVTLCSDKIRAAPEKRVFHVKEFIDELSNYKAKPLKHLLENASRVSDSEDSSQEDMPPTKKPCTETENVITLDDVEVVAEQPIAISKDAQSTHSPSMNSNGIVQNHEQKNRPDSEQVPPAKNNQSVERQNKSRWFYNSSNAQNNSDDSFEMLGFVPKIPVELHSTVHDLNDSDVICLDDDDEETCEKDDSSVKVLEKQQNTSKSDASCKLQSLNSSLNRSEKQVVTNSLVSTGIRTDNNVNSSKSDNKIPSPSEAEVICLDDDEDDIDDDGKKPAVDPKVKDTTPLHSLLNYRFPVKQIFEKFKSLSQKNVKNLAVIEIDADEKSGEEEDSLPKDSNEKPSSTSTLFIGGHPKTTEVKDNSCSDKETVCLENMETANSVVGSEDCNSRLLSGDSDVECSERAPVQRDCEHNSGSPAVMADEEMACDGDELINNADSFRQITELEQLLQKLSKDIQSLEKAELTLDDLNSEDSSFIQEAKLKSEFMETWKKLCDVAHYPKTTGRPTEKRLNLEIPDYPEIGKEVLKFMNESQDFPDFADIYDIVLSCNNKCGLSLTDEKLNHISEVTFTSIGNRLQKLRKLELAEHFQSYLPDYLRSYDDPAMYDHELWQKLKENQMLAKQRLDEVLNSFGKRQELEDDKTASESNDEDDDDSDDDDNDESESNEIVESSSDVLLNVVEQHLPKEVELLSAGIDPPVNVELCSDTVPSVSNTEANRDDLPEGDVEESHENDDSVDASHQDSDDVLIIRFDDCSKLCDESENPNNDQQMTVCKTDEVEEKEFDNADISSDNQTQNNSNFKFRGDLLDNIRKLTSCANLKQKVFVAEGACEKLSDSAICKTVTTDGRNCMQKISEVEICEDEDEAGCLLDDSSSDALHLSDKQLVETNSSGVLGCEAENDSEFHHSIGGISSDAVQDKISDVMIPSLIKSSEEAETDSTTKYDIEMVTGENVNVCETFNAESSPDKRISDDHDMCSQTSAVNVIHEGRILESEVADVRISSPLRSDIIPSASGHHSPSSSSFCLSNSNSVSPKPAKSGEVDIVDDDLCSSPDLKLQLESSFEVDETPLPSSALPSHENEASVLQQSCRKPISLLENLRDACAKKLVADAFVSQRKSCTNSRRGEIGETDRKHLCISEVIEVDEKEHHNETVIVLLDTSPSRDSRDDDSLERDGSGKVMNTVTSIKESKL